MKLVINFFPALRNARIVSVGYLQEFHEGYHSGILFPIFFFPFPIHIHLLSLIIKSNAVVENTYAVTIIDSVIDSYQKLSNIENNNDINIYIYIYIQYTCFGQ